MGNLIQLGDIFLCQLHIQGFYIVLKVRRGSSSNNHAADTGA